MNYVRKSNKNSVDICKREGYTGALLCVSTRRTRVSRTHCRRVSPLGREGLAILALRKLYRQPYFFSLLYRHDPWTVLGNGALHLSLSPVLLW